MAGRSRRFRANSLQSALREPEEPLTQGKLLVEANANGFFAMEHRNATKPAPHRNTAPCLNWQPKTRTGQTCPDVKHDSYRE